ncbi:MAG: YtxH domain-containing protein [Bacteroidetes bacterium]|nr:YtxH domain-containing protein [Bacteroidota bacterium]MCH8523502.1 YtxH domain-containing protein [Balneolales bacterium]
MENAKIFAGALVGAAIGAALGVLFSPAKGSTTRRRLKRRGQDFVDEVEDNLSEFYDEVSKSYSTVLDEAQALAEKGKDAVSSKLK